MRFTRRTDYAIHLIADLSEQPDCCLGLRTLAADHGVTYAFARTVQQGLLKANIIETARGINGGIKLARLPKDITLLEVFEAAQDSLDSSFSTAGTSWCNCEEDSCLTEKFWDSVKTTLRDHLETITMDSLLQLP
jgi:Rrf2 family protein